MNTSNIIATPRQAIIAAIEHAYHYSPSYQKKLDKLIGNENELLADVLCELPDEDLIKAIELTA